jgi:hypothetical protein
MAAKNATIGALRVELGLGTAQFDKGLKEAGAKLGGFGKLAAGAGVAVGAAMAGAATAMGMAVKSSLDAADQMGEMAEKVGMAVGALSKLSYAAKVNGVSSETLEKGLRRLADSMLKIRDGGGGAAANALNRLGVEVLDANGALRASSDVMTDLIGKFGAMPNGVVKTATAMELFGRSGADMIPLLNAGAEGLAELSAEAERLGLVIDDKTAAAAARFNDNLTRLMAVQDGITTQLAAELAPALAAVSDVLVDTANDAELMRQVGVGLDRTIRGLVTGALALAAGLQLAGNSARGMNEAVGLAARGRFGDAAKAFTDRAEASVDSIESIRKQISRLWSDAAEASAVGAEAVQTRGFVPIARGAQATARAVGAARDEVKAALDELARDLDKVRDRTLSPQERRAQQIREDVRVVQAAFAKGLIDAQEMHGLIGKMGDGLKLISAPIIDDLKKLGDVQLDRPLDSLRNRAEEIAEAFAEVAWSVDGIAYALKHNDWAGAARGLMDVIKSIQSASAMGGPGMAIGAAAGAVAPMVGGVAGSALSGMAGGAQLGMMLGGPLGAGIGAALGGIAGFLSGSSSKKAAKKAEAERQALEAYNKQMEILAQRRALELRIMELQGDAAGALAARRADELAAMDAESRALQAQIFALEDKAELEAKRASFDAAFLTDGQAMAGVMGEVAGELARLGYTGVATRDQFKALVLGLDQTTEAGAATYRALLDVAPKFLQVADYLDQVRASAEGQVEAARQTLISAYERESGALKGVIDKFRAFAATLRQFRDSLLAGPAAQLSPGAQYRVTRSQFEGARSRALAGDEDALAALPAYAEAFLDSARTIAPNAAAYARDLAAVRNAVQAAEQIAGGEADTALAQLAAMEAQVGQLVALNAGMMSVAEAIAALAQAQADASAQIAAAMAQAVAVTQIPAGPATPAAPQIWSPQGYAAANPDVAAWASGAVGQKGFDGQVINSVDQALSYHWRHHGSMEGRGFANGGGFKVGGFGGTDSQFMPLMLTPGEMVDVRRPGAMRNGEETLAREMAGVKDALRQVALSTRETERRLTLFDRNGLFVRGPDPLAPVVTEAA